MNLSIWAVLQALAVIDLLNSRIGPWGARHAFGKWYKIQPYIVAGYMHIPFDGTIWRGKHLWAYVACLLLAIGMSSALDCMQQVKQNIHQFCILQTELLFLARVPE